MRTVRVVRATWVFSRLRRGSWGAPGRGRGGATWGCIRFGERLRGAGTEWPQGSAGALGQVGSRGCVRGLGSGDGWLTAARVGLGGARRFAEMLDSQGRHWLGAG